MGETIKNLGFSQAGLAFSWLHHQLAASGIYSAQHRAWGALSAAVVGDTDAVNRRILVFDPRRVSPVTSLKCCYGTDNETCSLYREDQRDDT